MSLMGSPSDVFQFTLPCRERLPQLLERRHAPDVSIHAPV